jgi:hypothetical protein
VRGVLHLGGPSAVAASVALIVAGTPQAKLYPGVLPKPLFATPDRAAYCYLSLTTLDDRGAKLRCWTPNDGFAASIAWRADRAETAYFTTRPQIAHSVGVLKGYAPKAPMLSFGERVRIRCRTPADVTTCPARRGRLTFTCTSAGTGLTCTNTRGHGFWLGRFRGYRLF